MADIPLDTRPTLARLKKSGKKRNITLRDYPAEWLPVLPPALEFKEQSRIEVGDGLVEHEHAKEEENSTSAAW
jgi:hypothetical protein